MTMTKGQLEDKISAAITRFEKEHLGRGPEEVKTFILGDVILVRLKGILTPAEQQLSRNHDGRLLVKQVRVQLIENSKPLLEEILQTLTGRNVITIHSDISTINGERGFVFILDQEIAF